MAGINVSIRMDEDLKHQADALFEDLGLSFSGAVNVFVRQAVREGGKTGLATAGIVLGIISIVCGLSTAIVMSL